MHLLHFLRAIRILRPHILVAVPHKADRKVDQEQINVLQAAVRQRPSEQTLHLIGPVERVPQFRHVEDVLATHRALGDLLADRLAHLRLVAVQIGGVEVPVAGVDGVAYRLHSLAAGGLYTKWGPILNSGGFAHKLFLTAYVPKPRAGISRPLFSFTVGASTIFAI